jgi:hypothetical protein
MTSAREHRSMFTTRSLFTSDATFELALGALLAAGAAAGWLTHADAPVPASATGATGAAFVLAGTSQFAYFIRSPRRVQLELAAGNAAMALAALVWLVVARGFSMTGVVIMSAAIAWKLAIGSLQLQSLLGQRPVPYGR